MERLLRDECRAASSISNMSLSLALHFCGYVCSFSKEALMSRSLFIPRDLGIYMMSSYLHAVLVMSK